MAIISKNHPAFGAPGIEPRWTRGAKDAVGTAYSVASAVWFTVSTGILNEVYYPTIDRPQIRDLQFMVTDGSTFFEDERHMRHQTEYLHPHALGLRITNFDRAGRFTIVKEIITDPHQSCILIRARLEGTAKMISAMRLFVLLAPHVDGAGWGNNANLVEAGGRSVLTAHRDDTWLALGANVPFVRSSCGYVGTTDGWQDLNENFEMDLEFDSATNGNLALTAELNLSKGNQFTLALAFGDGLHRAVTTLLQSLGVPFDDHRARFVVQWDRAISRLAPLEDSSGDEGRLYHTSHSLLLAHEDKTYPGALIAALSIPWGETRSDEDLGGYHLVWTRDMINSATGLLAAGNSSVPLRALIYLACSQLPDGGFYQNFWINGEPYWRGTQLDEVSFPIMLAWRLQEANGLNDFDPYPMVMRAAYFLITRGPATQQERWEENSGYSPSTLASNIASLVCASSMARARGDSIAGKFLLEYAEFLESHLEQWTVTTQGTLVPGIDRHFIRILPIDLTDPRAEEDPNRAVLELKNQAPEVPRSHPAKEVVDPGFLELVRYGIRRPADPLIEDSLKVVDHVIKTDFPCGPCWRRYNHDGYGQLADGSPFRGWGVGRSWPLLTGERGHYELAAGRDPRPYIQAMEGFATTTGLLPEQVWDEPDRPSTLMYFGKPTGAAMPLMWAHAEYIKLLRSTRDDRVFDLIPEVANHFGRRPRKGSRLEVWKFNRQVRSVAPGETLRVINHSAFILHWTLGEWSEVSDTRSSPVSIGINYADVPVPASRQGPLRFTFFWPDEDRWEGQDFTVEIRHP